MKQANRFSVDALSRHPGKTMFERYMREISKVPLLSPEEETQLAKRKRAGDLQATDRLIKANLRFVVLTAKQYQNRGVDLMDLICEGNRGLIKAVNKYDETRGFKFISFAVWWIRQTIMLAIADQNRNIKIPLNAVSAIAKINKAEINFEQRHERLPTMRELSEELGIAENGIQFFRENGQLTASLDAICSNDLPLTLNDTLQSPGPAADHLLIDTGNLDHYLSMFKPLRKIERSVLACYFGLRGQPAMSLDQIAHEHNLSRERIRQIKDRGLAGIRASIVAGKSA